MPQSSFSTIRGKIFITLILLSSVLMLVLVFVSISLFGIVSRYDNTLNQLVGIYRITSISELYAEKYLTSVQNASVNRYSEEFAEVKASLEEALSKLNLEQSIEITTQASGVANIVQKMLEAGDNGFQAAKAGNIVAGYDGYREINNYNFYIKDNIATLAILQLEQVESIQARMEQERQTTIYLMGGLGIVIIVASFIYAQYFSGSITNPLLDLSSKIKAFGVQDYKTDIAGKLVTRTDEVGVLAKTFEEMRQRIVSAMQAQQQSQEELVKLNQKLEGNNQDLSEMNKVMIGREMKMIEQKKEIEELKAKLGAS